MLLHPSPQIPGSYGSIFLGLSSPKTDASRAWSSPSSHEGAQYIGPGRYPPPNLPLRLRGPGTPEVSVIPTCEQALTDGLKSHL